MVQCCKKFWNKSRRNRSNSKGFWAPSSQHELSGTVCSVPSSQPYPSLHAISPSPDRIRLLQAAVSKPVALPSGFIDNQYRFADRGTQVRARALILSTFHVARDTPVVSIGARKSLKARLSPVKRELFEYVEASSSALLFVDGKIFKLREHRVELQKVIKSVCVRACVCVCVCEEERGNGYRSASRCESFFIVDSASCGPYLLEVTNLILRERCTSGKPFQFPVATRRASVSVSAAVLARSFTEPRPEVRRGCVVVCSLAMEEASCESQAQVESLYEAYNTEKNETNLFSLDALLADLQNTVSSEGNHVGSNATPGYGSLNGARTGAYRSYDNRTSPLPAQSPTYQNREAIEETIGKSSAGGKTPSLNNNLSELDTLLQDLSNAHYNAHYQERENRVSSGMNGDSSPMLRSPSSMSASRPTVDSLLEELSTAVPNGDYSSDGRVKVTIQETSTEIQPVYDGYNSRQGSLNRSEVQRGYTNGHTASNATKELDDLMASLSDFKINSGSHQHQTVTDSPYAKPNKATKSSQSPLPPEGTQTRIHITETHTTHHYQQQHGEPYPPQPAAQHKQNQLDSMLGNLQADMSRQGVNTTQKGCCSACEKPIVGQVITALGKTWHPEHFTCTHCNQELGTRNFFEREGQPYCESDYHNLFSPRCAYCNGPILDKCVTALEKTWHTEHFFCAQCGKQFGEEGFHERDGKPYCREDYFDMFAPKCGGCNRAIMENYISALNSQWHPDCFVCRDCRQKFQGGSFFDHEGLPYCETHYHAKRGSLCAGCHKPITGRCITAMFRKFHPQHFVCAFCLKQLNKGTFKEQNDKPYCHGCFDKLFG